ncbi:MAG TPA: GNAT family N-acetyltransferase, partial [Candidatus Dormibacteraeota bacterium]|nr:GNAT family N-acetyltransferase [Candidatus Dormibacteraeota bacterium]
MGPVATGANALTIRPLAGADELDLFLQLPYVLNEEMQEDLAHGRRRPEWMWVALRGTRLIARLAWWTSRGGGTPSRLDVLDIDDGLRDPDRVSIGAELLRAALSATIPNELTPPDFGRFVPPGWREDPLMRQAVGDRMTILQ